MSKKISEKSWTFDPVRDIQAVEQFGFIDIVQANKTSSVPASIPLERESSTSIEAGTEEVLLA